MVVTQGGMTLPTKSRDLLITWLRSKEKTLLPDFYITYDYQTWQSGNLGWGDHTHHITRPYDLEATWQLKHIISDFYVTYRPKVWQGSDSGKWIPPTGSRNHMISWKTENFISTLPENLWQPNLAWWWLRVGNSNLHTLQKVPLLAINSASNTVAAFITTSLDVNIYYFYNLGYSFSNNFYRAPFEENHVS